MSISIMNRKTGELTEIYSAEIIGGTITTIKVLAKASRKNLDWLFENSDEDLDLVVMYSEESDRYNVTEACNITPIWSDVSVLEFRRVNPFK